MGRSGGRISDLIEAMKEPTRNAAHDMADGGGQRMVDITKANTPVERFLKNVDTPPPYHLRNSIELKSMKVFDGGAETTYETGAETDVFYAPYVEEGTGLWGPKKAKYIIRPKKPGGWLSWITEKGFTRKDGTVVPPGTRVFAKEVHHPGSPGQHMFAIGAQMTEHEFGEVADRALADWKRKIDQLRFA